MSRFDAYNEGRDRDVQFIKEDGRPSLIQLKDDELEFNFHPGQIEAWECEKRFIAIIAGTQGGKTSFSCCWLHGEMMVCGPGDYLVVSPTFMLMENKALPEYKAYFEDLLDVGKYRPGKKELEISPEGAHYLWGREQKGCRILFRHADDPESLESASILAAVLDECGQHKFKREAYEAARRRVSLGRGRILLPSTPYNFGWFYKDFWKVWEDAGGDHPDIHCVSFASNMNPEFPDEEFELARRDLPAWKFSMFYEGKFTRPAGLIYDNFDHDRHVVSEQKFPPAYHRIVGVDFGGVNTAAVFLARHGNTWYVYKEYKAGSKSASQHVLAMLAGESPEQSLKWQAYGGAPGEVQWRREFKKAGLHIRRPIVSDVEVGIDRVRKGFESDGLVIMDNCTELIGEIESYSRKLDSEGKPTEDIDGKGKYHLLDALRYAFHVAKLGGGAKKKWKAVATKAFH